MRTIALCLLIACSKPLPAPHPTSNTEAATSPATAAEPAELGAIRTADRAEIRWVQANKKAERTGAELKTLIDALVVSEQMPSGGENIAEITFYKGPQKVGVVWSFHDGEWGISGIGKTQGLSPALAELLKQ
jgi:hypothetical protein